MGSRKSKGKRYAFVHPVTRQFVAATAKGAVRIAVKAPSKLATKPRVFRDSKGRFSTPQKAARSQASKKGAKKAAQTRAIQKGGGKFLRDYYTEPGQHRRRYGLRELNRDTLEMMIRREIPEGRNPSFYVVVHYVDSDGNPQHRQTGWADAVEGNAEATIDAALAMLDRYEVDEVLDIDVVFAFSTKVGKD